MLRLGIDPEKLYRATFIRHYGLSCCNMALVSFRLFCKNLGHMREFFGQMVYRPPWQKISRTPMHYHCYDLFVCLFVFMLKLLQYCNYTIIVMQIKLMLLLLIGGKFVRWDVPFTWNHFSSTKIKRVLTWHRGDLRDGASSLRFPLVALHLFTWYHHKMLCRRESPRREFTPVFYRGEIVTPVRNLRTVSCKRETTTSFGVKSVCW